LKLQNLHKLFSAKSTIFQNGGAKILFTHEGLVPEKECYARCEQGWIGHNGKTTTILYSHHAFI